MFGQYQENQRFLSKSQYLFEASLIKSLNKIVCNEMKYNISVHI